MSEVSDAAALRARKKPLRWWLERFGSAAVFFLVGVALIVLLGVAQRIGWIRSELPNSVEATGRATTPVHTCPMHPQIRQPGSGRCPICGMPLVPASSATFDVDSLAINIDPAQRRLANIETATVTHQEVSTTIRTIGAIEIDESRQATIASYIDGRIERLFADYTGVVVDSGDHLAVVYSPQLYSAQVEYLEAKNTLARSSEATLASVREAQRRLVTNSRQRLAELGMNDEQLADLDNSGTAQSRLTIFSTIGGTVIEKLVEEGKYVSAGEPIYRIANLSTIWLMLELYPEDASRVRFGQLVNAELSSLPGKTLKGRIAFIDAQVDRTKRTVGVRVEFNNGNGELRPGDYAQASIEIPIGPQGKVYDSELAGKWISPMHPQIIRDQAGDCPICGMKLVPTSRYGYSETPVSREKSITAPRSAVLMAGENSVVYVETEPGRFEIRNVKLGSILRDEVVVLDGLQVGEKVATAGNFLIDSQMQLAGKPSLIDPTKAIPKPPFRNTPLSFGKIDIRHVEGETGNSVETLYNAYFQVQRSLAADQVPQEKPVLLLEDVATQLAESGSLSNDVVEQLEIIRENVPHLHHQSLEAARQNFKPVSHAVVTLATKIRGVDAESPFNHFFCPMVKQGEGDWLQPDAVLSNPYYGSEMLRCGELVRTLDPAAEAAEARSNEDVTPDEDVDREIEGN